MKQPIDHLRGKKKPARKTVWVAGDSEKAQELADLEAGLSRIEGSLNLIPQERVERREAALREKAETERKIEALKSELRETSIMFVFQAIGRKKFDQLLSEHQPTDEQVKAHEAEGNKDPIEFNPDTFPPALIAACTVEPSDVDKADLEAWLRDGDEWGAAEIMNLFMAAFQVNQARGLVNLGKG